MKCKVNKFFFNKILSEGEKTELILIDNVGEDNFLDNSTLFKVEKINQRKKNLNQYIDTEKESDNNKEREESEDK